MACICGEYGPIELDRASINRRIKEFGILSKHLVAVVTNDVKRLTLYRCSTCSQLWQSGFEWNFGGKEYLFQVPQISVDDWRNEPFIQPADLMLYATTLDQFLSRGTFEPGKRPCKTDGCDKQAVTMSVFCKRHHIESLQRSKLLRSPPLGREFEPYRSLCEKIRDSF